MSTAPKDLTTSLTKLSISPSESKKAKAPIADSWEDSDSGSDTEQQLPTPQTSSYPAAPPPTPISPTTFDNPYGYRPDSDTGVRSARDREGARPEKTDAVAKRLIAGALGVRAPKKTEEQRAYDKAIRDKEMKRRNAEKEAVVKAKAEAERAKSAVWDD